MNLLAQVELPGSPAEWVMWGSLGLLMLVVFSYITSATIRRYLGRSDYGAPPPDEFAPKRPDAADPAFAAASMQAVIKRLKEQEKELERLHRAEKERAEQTERLSEAVTRDMPTGLLLMNAAGLITLANPAAKHTLGAEALGYRRYSEALGEEAELTRLIAECLANASTFQREEIDHTIPSGAVRRLGVTISPVYQPPGDARGKIVGAVCLLTDLTQMIALQQQVRMKENLAALGEMSAGIAHEFKNALATIAGYAQMIQKEPAANDTGENAARILQQTQNLSHVVTEFLRFSRPLDVSLGEVELRPLLERVQQEAACSFPETTFALEGEFAACVGDEGLLRQAFLNLVRNAAEAIRATGKGGTITIAGDAGGARGGQVITVRDDGPGIPEADLPKIFLPFYTTKSDGNGLGLALVQKIVIHHGGSVQGGNRPHGGAEFIVWLPQGSASAQAIESTLSGI